MDPDIDALFAHDYVPVPAPAAAPTRKRTHKSSKGKEEKKKPKAKGKKEKKPKPKGKKEKPKGKKAKKPKPKEPAAKPKRKRSRTAKTPEVPLEEAVARTEAEVSAVASVSASADIGTYTVPGGTRKSKVRRSVTTGIESSAVGESPLTTEAPLPALAAGLSRTFGDMPHLEDAFALDDWMQRYRDSAAHTASIEAKQKSIADAIRASLRPEDEEQKLKLKQKQEPEPIKELSVEDFFRGDVDTPLVGSAADMHALLSQMRTDADLRETLSRTAAREAETVRAKAAAAKGKKKKRKKGKAEEPKIDDDAVMDGASRTQLESCSRAYCADFLREPRGEEFGERKCRRGQSCVFVMMAGRYPDTAVESTIEEGFVCREFLRPSELDVWKAAGTLPEASQLCLGCNRMLTTFYYYMYQSRGEAPVELIQTHYNPVGAPGDYETARCLYPNPDPSKWTGIARPFVEFAPNTFVYVEFELTANTTGRVWRLLGVQEVMTDFRLSPSSYYRAAAEEAEATAQIVAGTDDDESSGLAQDPRGAWVSGLPGIAIMRGVPPCRPLRPAEWIESEMAICPAAPGFGALPELVPRLLLGKAFPDYALYVFCPFKTTLKAVRKKTSSFFMAMYSRLRYSHEMHSFNWDILNAVLKDVQENVDDAAFKKTEYKILLAVLYRIEFATKLMGVGKDRRYDYWLQLFVDTHIDLCIAMHTTGFFDDASIECADLNPNSIAESVLEQNFPYDTRCAHAGDLPDLSVCVQFASVWFQMRAKPKADNIAEALVHLVACKTQTHKCQVRNFASIAYAYASQFPQIMTLLRALITVSMLGNYPHARRHPDFASRLHMTYSTRPEVTTDRELFLWIAENEHLAYAIVKEYYRYLVAQRPAFEAVLGETTHWNTVRDYICDAMDRARSMLSMAVGSGTLCGKPYGQQRPGHVGHGPPDPKAPRIGGDSKLHAECMRTIAADMKTLHEYSELPLITKLRKGTFTSIIVPNMSTFFTHHVLDDHAVRPQTSLISLAAIDGKEVAAEIVRAMREVIEKRVARHDSREPIEMRWLAYFGVTPEGVAAIRALCYDYETKDIADNSIARRISAIYEHSPRDFFVIHTFFKIVVDWRATAKFRLPLCYAEAQAAVLRAKTFTPPWKALPPRSDVFYWCPSCMRWLSDAVDITDADTRDNMYSINFNHTLYSYDTDQIYCDRQKVSVNTRKQVESGKYDDPTTYVEDAREARRVRHYLGTPACCSAPAIPVHMLGVCQRLGGKLWALCECCASITQWEGAKFGPTGFTCGFHAPDAPRNMTAHQAEALRVRRKREKMPAADNCTYCNNSIKPGDDYTQIIVLDDCGVEVFDKSEPSGKRRTKASWTYKAYVMCRTDSNAIYRCEDPVLRLSVVETYIKKAHDWRMANLMCRYSGKT